MLKDGYGICSKNEDCELFNIDSEEWLNFLKEVLSRKFSDNKLLNEKMEEYKKTGYGVDFKDFKDFKLFDVYGLGEHKEGWDDKLNLIFN